MANVQNFRVYEVRTSYRTFPIPKDPALLIPGGKFLAVDGGKLAILATAGSTAIAYTEDGAPVGQSFVNIVAQDDVLFAGTADANFAITDLYNEVDLVISGSDQQIDIGASTTDVLKIIPEVNDTAANVVGSPLNIIVKINKFLMDVI